MSSTNSSASWLYHTVAIRNISMILLFGCLVLSTLGGVSPLYVYAFLALLYAITLVTVVWSCTGVMNQLPNSISTKNKIMGRLLPLLSVAMFSLIGGGTLNVIAWSQQWSLGFPSHNEMIFNFFYFLIFEGLPSTAVLIILFRMKPVKKIGMGLSAETGAADQTLRLVGSSEGGAHKRMDYGGADVSPNLTSV